MCSAVCPMLAGISWCCCMDYGFYDHGDMRFTFYFKSGSYEVCDEVGLDDLGYDLQGWLNLSDDERHAVLVERLFKWLAENEDIVYGELPPTNQKN